MRSKSFFKVFVVRFQQKNKKYSQYIGVNIKGLVIVCQPCQKMHQLSLQWSADWGSCFWLKSRTLTFISQWRPRSNCCIGRKQLLWPELNSLAEFLVFCRSHGKPDFRNHADHSLWPKVIKTFNRPNLTVTHFKIQNPVSWRLIDHWWLRVSGSPTKTRPGTAGRTMLTFTAARSWRYNSRRKILQVNTGCLF